MLNQRIDIDSVAGNKGAERTDCFGQRTEQQCVALGFKVKTGEAAAPLGSDNAKPMRIVDNHHGIVLLAARIQRTDRCNIAVHTEHAISDQQFASGLLLRFVCGERFIGGRHIDMMVATKFGVAYFGTINDRSMIQAILNQ